MKTRLAVIFIPLLTACGVQKKPEFIFYQGGQDTSLFTAGKSYYSALYIIKNYSSGKKCELATDSFARKLGDGNHYDSFSLDFYKESKKTNLESLSKNPRDLDRYSDLKDHVLSYDWYKGNFSGKTKIKNGQMVGDSGVKLSPAPPLNSANQ